MGAANNALGGVETHYYLPVFAAGAGINSNALTNIGEDFGGVQFTSAAACASPGQNVGADLNIQADLLVPTDASHHITEAGPYIRSRSANPNDGIIAGAASDPSGGYWVQLRSTGEVRVTDLRSNTVVADSGTPASFDTTVFHTLETAAQGTNLQVSLDSQLVTFCGASSPVTNVPILTNTNLPGDTSPGNDGTAGIAFSAEANRGAIGGQRADNLVVSSYASLSGLPTNDTCTPEAASVSGHIIRADTSAALAGAIVALCTNTCSTTNSDNDGFYSLTGLPAGDYVLFVFPPNSNAPIRPYESDPFQVAATDVILNKDATLEVARLPAEGTTFSPQLNPNQAVPWIAWNAPTNMTEPGPPGLGTISAEVVQNGVTIATFTLTETPAGSGSYSGTIPDLQPHHGWAHVIKHVGGIDETFDIWIDPSGAVKTVNGDAIQGATVTLYRSDSASGPFEVVPNGSDVMSIANQVNPGSTDVNGHFGWDVVAGFYKVRAEKSGCFDPANSSQAFVESDVLTIPPPVTDLDLRLDCSGAATPEVWGDADCNGSIAPRDGQAILNHFLGQMELSQTQPCPAIGDTVTIDGVPYIWGDPDCNGSVAPRDGQAILNHFLGQTELSQTQPCPPVGSTVTLH